MSFSTVTPLNKIYSRSVGNRDLKTAFVSWVPVTDRPRRSKIIDRRLQELWPISYRRYENLSDARLFSTEVSFTLRNLNMRNFLLLLCIAFASAYDIQRDPNFEDCP